MLLIPVFPFIYESQYDWNIHCYLYQSFHSYMDVNMTKLSIVTNISLSIYLIM